MTSTGFIITSFQSLMSTVYMWVLILKSTEVDRFTSSDVVSCALETWILWFRRCCVLKLQLWFTIAVLSYETKLIPWWNAVLMDCYYSRCLPWCLCTKQTTVGRWRVPLDSSSVFWRVLLLWTLSISPALQQQSHVTKMNFAEVYPSFWLKPGKGMITLPSWVRASSRTAVMAHSGAATAPGVHGKDGMPGMSFGTSQEWILGGGMARGQHWELGGASAPAVFNLCINWPQPSVLLPRTMLRVIC